MSLFGLVLSGGLSTRMGRDKGSLVYPSLSPLDQRSRAVSLLRPYCEEVYVSCRKEQLPLPFPAIADTVLDAGPAGGILSAHLRHPAAAWLVFACDFPYADLASMQRLISSRQSALAATCYLQPDGTLEPLFAIWELPALQALNSAFARSELSPRRVLEGLPCAHVSPATAEALLNVNVPMPLLEMR